MQVHYSMIGRVRLSITSSWGLPVGASPLRPGRTFAPTGSGLYGAPASINASIVGRIALYPSSHNAAFTLPRSYTVLCFLCTLRAR
jgi:hypothetical protein